MRIFIAVRLNKSTVSYLKAMSNQLSGYFIKARYTRAENYHITMKYIGDSDHSTLNRIIRAVKAAASQTNSFKINTDGAGNFKRGNRYIFYCAVKESGDLIKLHTVLCNELLKENIDIDRKKLTPHITLAREVESVGGYDKIDFRNHEIDVDGLSVMESTRINGKLTYIPRYSVKTGGIGK